MSTHNDGSTFDRDDAALVTDGTVPTAAAASGDLDDVGDTPSGYEDTTVGSVDAAEAEFEASGGTPELPDSAPSTPDAATGVGDTSPSEPVDRFDDEPPASGPELTFVPSARQPNTQGDDPIYAEMGDEGQGDLSPEDQL